MAVRRRMLIVVPALLFPSIHHHNRHALCDVYDWRVCWHILQPLVLPAHTFASIDIRHNGLPILAHGWIHAPPFDTVGRMFHCLMLVVPVQMLHNNRTTIPLARWA
jgi:hypothetical protein